MVSSTLKKYLKIFLFIGIVIGIVFVINGIIPSPWNIQCLIWAFLFTMYILLL